MAGFPPAASRRGFHPNWGTFMCMLAILVAAISVIALTACAPPADDSGQPRRGQAGPYIGGSGGFGY
jgi:hypothetical protein